MNKLILIGRGILSKALQFEELMNKSNQLHKQTRHRVITTISIKMMDTIQKR